MAYSVGQAVEQRKAFGEALISLGDEFPDLVVLDPDVCLSTQTGLFRDKYPERFYQTGIAEQNAVGIAAGLSTMGFVPFVSAFAVFLTHRAGDQIRNLVAHPRANVKLNGAYGGLPTGRAGATHSSVEDIALMRALPKMTIMEPADATEAALCTRMALEMDGPVYLRTVRCAVPTIFGPEHRLVPGRGVWLQQGSDITIIATGMMTPRASEAVKSLRAEGIDAALLHIPFIKPLDTEAVLQAAATGAIITVENHSVIGGLGSAVAEAVAEQGGCAVHRMGFGDIFMESGDDEVLFARSGLNAEGIVAKAKQVLNKK